MTKYDSLANLEEYISIRTGGKQRATAEVRYVTRKGGRLPCLALPFLIAGCCAFAVHLGSFCKGMDARGVYEQIVAVGRVSCTQNG